MAEFFLLHKDEEIRNDRKKMIRRNILPVVLAGHAASLIRAMSFGPRTVAEYKRWALFTR